MQYLVLILFLYTFSSVSFSAGQSISTFYQTQTSNIQVRSDGIVVRILADDNTGSRHQKFILKLSTGQTVLISHNIDLAPRISSIKVGDAVEFYGEYEWNAKGGVVHWTHHDPAKRHPGGWLKHNGVVYE